MRKNFVVWLLCLGCIVSVLNANEGSRNTQSIGSANEAAQLSLLWMNYFNFVVTKILTYNDKLVLELEYNKLDDNLNFDTISDDRCFNMIKKMLAILKEMRFNEKEREYVLEDYEEFCDSLVLKSLTGAVWSEMEEWLEGTGLTEMKEYKVCAQILNSKICRHILDIVTNEKGRQVINKVGQQIPSLGPYTAVAMVCSMAMEEEKNCKREADLRKKVKIRELDKEKINELYQIRESMLEYIFDVLKTHNLPDRYRISKGNYQELLEYVQMDAKESYKLLNSEKCRQTFEKLPVYWFYLGKAAYEYGDQKTALYAYDRYEQENRRIFRNDETELNVCLGRALALLNVGKHEEDVFNQLEKVRKGAEIKNWRQRYVAASLFFAIGKYDEAKDLLMQNIAYLGEQLKKSKLSKYRDLLGTPNLTVDVFPDTSNLAIQRMLLALCLEKSRKQNEFIKELDSAEKELCISAAEMCCHWGALKNEQIFERLKVYMQGVEGSLKQGRVFSEAELQIPFIWFYAGKPDFNIEFIGADGSLALVKDHKISLNKEKAKIMLTFKLDRKLPFAQVKHAKVVVKHPLCNVQLLFSVAPLPGAKSWNIRKSTRLALVGALPEVKEWYNIPPRAFKLESCEFMEQQYKF